MWSTAAGPHCNGADCAAVQLSRLGRKVNEAPVRIILDKVRTVGQQNRDCKGAEWSSYFGDMTLLKKGRGRLKPAPPDPVP